jgi:hypothetical protein
MLILQGYSPQFQPVLGMGRVGSCQAVVGCWVGLSCCILFTRGCRLLRVKAMPCCSKAMPCWRASCRCTGFTRAHASVVSAVQLCGSVGTAMHDVSHVNGLLVAQVADTSSWRQSASACSHEAARFGCSADASQQAQQAFETQPLSCRVLLSC